MSGNSNFSRTALRSAVLIAILAAGAWFAWKATRPQPVAVRVASVDLGRVEATVSNTRAGSVSACRRARLAPPAGGRIDRLAVREGDRVKQGQLLLQLWNEDLIARERIAREQLGTAQSHVREACLRAQTVAREADRQRKLQDQSFVSQERFERADSEARIQQATCESAHAQVLEAEARVAAARADTVRTVLNAPFDGIVAEVNGEIGEYLTPSPPGIPTLPAVDLIDDSCLYVSAPIDEIDAAQLKVGMSGRITLDAYRGTHFAGTVRRIAPYVLALEKQARTVEVEVEFVDPGRTRHLLVGYSADIEVIVSARDGVARIPTTALMPGNRVLRLGEDGVLDERRIETGLSNWEYTEVRSGLARGDRVVTSLERAGVRQGAAATEDVTPAAATTR